MAAALQAGGPIAGAELLLKHDAWVSCKGMSKEEAVRKELRWPRAERKVQLTDRLDSEIMPFTDEEVRRDHSGTLPETWA